MMYEQIGPNSSCHNDLDPIIKRNGKWIFPEKFKKYFIDFVDVHDFDSVSIRNKICYITDPTITRETLALFQQSYYNIEHYIDLVPTIESIVSDPLTYDDIQEILTKPRSSFIYEFCSHLMNKSYFFRLNSISPKDVKIKGKRECKVGSGEDIKTLMRLSERTRYYLDNFDERIQIRLVLREWIDEFPTEFRCFIRGNKLRAISQNSEDCCYKEKTKNKIYEEILEFYRSIKYEIPFEDAVMDISKIEEKWIVIEFNVFGAETKTGSSLFNWKDDYEVLYNAQVPIIKFLV